MLGKGSWTLHFRFLPTHDDPDKSRQGILGTANSHNYSDKNSFLQNKQINKPTQTTFPYWTWASQGIWRIPVNIKLFISNEAVVETSCEAACMPDRVMTLKNLYWPKQVCLWNCLGLTRHSHILKREDMKENKELQEGYQKIFQRRKVEIIISWHATLSWFVDELLPDLS